MIKLTGGVKLFLDDSLKSKGAKETLDRKQIEYVECPPSELPTGIESPALFHAGKWHSGAERIAAWVILVVLRRHKDPAHSMFAQ